jgi:peptide/nickel transport system permease protein
VPATAGAPGGGSRVAGAPPVPRHRARRAAGRRPVGAALLLGVFALLIVLPSLVALPAYDVDLADALAPPSLAHPLGTDENGRDALARLLVGARATLGIAAGGAALAVVLGAALGVVAGYAGGATDAALMRGVDLALAFPSLFVILLCAAFVRPGAPQLILLLGLTGWMPVARLVRGRVRELRRAPFIEAAQAVGAGHFRLLVRHLLPNAGAVLFVAAVVQLNRAILAEATVSFLGLGIQPPEPTWGNLLTGAQGYLYGAPWLAVAPGLAIAASLLAVYWLGMDRALSPQTARRSVRGDAPAAPG